eukprot:gene3833-15125_t
MATVKSVTVRDIAVWNKEKFEEGLGFAKTMFGISSMHEEQLEALRHFFLGKHLYFSAPTGYGKSLIYQVIPFVNDYLMNQLTLPSCILVVTPLQSLMLDQVSKLRALGINTAAIYADQSEEVLLEIENGGETAAQAIDHIEGQIKSNFKKKQGIVPEGDTPGKSNAKKVSAVSSISNELFVESLKKNGTKVFMVEGGDLSSCGIHAERSPCWEYEIEDDLDVGSMNSVSGCVDVLSPDPVFDLSDFSNAVQGSQGTPEDGAILATALKMSSLSCLHGADADILTVSDTTSSTL